MPGGWQGDDISPNLLTTLYEYMFKSNNMEIYGVNTNGENIDHLHFADVAVAKVGTPARW